MRAYLTKESFIYRPVLLAGPVAVGKTWLARYVVRQFDGNYINIATDCFTELLRYSSLPKVPPEDVAELVQKYSRQQPAGPVFVDGLDAILTAIAAGQRSGILENFFSTMRRTRDLPYPTVMIIQLNRYLSESVLEKSNWWNEEDCYVLNLTPQDCRIIAENWQVVPAVADQAETALGIVFSRMM
jgi:hypothetical protein